jgi:hypothetical protein
LSWLQATPLAATVGGSVLLTAALSSIHLVGFTLIMGAAIVSNLRLIGVLLPGRTATEVTAPAARAILLGLSISIVTGALLFAPRALAAADNGIFRAKMLLLVTATAFHFSLHRGISREPSPARWRVRLIGALGLALWAGLALSGAAFILIE